MSVGICHNGVQDALTALALHAPALSSKGARKPGAKREIISRHSIERCGAGHAFCRSASAAEDPMHGRSVLERVHQVSEKELDDGSRHAASIHPDKGPRDVDP